MKKKTYIKSLKHLYKLTLKNNFIRKKKINKHLYDNSFRFSLLLDLCILFLLQNRSLNFKRHMI